MEDNGKRNNAGHIISKIRKERNLTQKEAAKKLQFATRTYQNIEGGKACLKYTDLLRIIEVLSFSDINVLTLFGLSTDYDSVSHDPSDPHRNRLEKYQNETYNFYFINSLKDRPETLNVVFYDIVGYCYVAGKGFLGDIQYECKLISPPDSDYTFIYFSCTKPLVDRAFFILPYNENDVVFGSGKGIMISISNEKPRGPILQNFIVINGQYEMPNVEESESFSAFLKEQLIFSHYVFNDTFLKFPEIISSSMTFSTSRQPLQEHAKRPKEMETEKSGDPQ